MASVTAKELSAVALLAALLLAGCGTQVAYESAGHSPETFLSQLRKASAPVPDPGVISDVPARLGLVIAVDGFPGHSPFATIARASQIEAYPCSQCHDKPLAGMLAMRKKNQPNSHWQITLKHAPEAIMNCETCHGTGDQDQLVSITGKTVSMDAPHQICGQCHAAQVADWAGGAHGKRLGGWAPPRVVQNCTGCHNPHIPVFETRWPAYLGTGVASYPGR